MQLLIMKQDRGVHFRGDIIEVRASNTPFGGKEPDSFVMVEVSDLPMTAYEKLSKAWERLIAFELVGSDPVQGGFRIRLYAEQVLNELGRITRNEVETFINNWGGTVFSVGENEVVFDIRIYDVLISKAFWEIDKSKVIFTEISYNESTGAHQISADYSALSNNPTYIERFVAGKGVTIINHADKILIYDADSTIIRSAFQNDIKEKSKKIIARRRYYVNDIVVTAIESNGGTYITDASTLAGYIKDKVVG